MKIAIVGPAHPYTGGSAQHTTELAHRLSTAGHQVSLQSWRSLYPPRLYPGQPTVAQPEVPLFPATERTLAWNRPAGWRRLGHRLGRDFDAVLLAVFTSRQVPSYLVMSKWARAGGCRVVALCHNVLPHESRSFDEPLMRALLRRCDAVLVHSPEQAALAAGMASTPVEVAALPLHWPKLARPACVAWRPRTPQHRLLFFGMVRPYKGLDLLIRALAETKPEITLTVAGEIWTSRSDLRRLVSDLQLADRVTLVDRYICADEVPAYFGAADALVLPYRSATASQNSLIALQFGLPVIASRVGAITAALEDGVNAILCAPGDVADLARAINQLYEPGVLERLQLGVRAPDPTLAWDCYLAAVLRASAAPSAEPGMRGAPPGRAHNDGTLN
ncbi:MAG: glycosyltransferase [Actinobacteria bacterium]|nr:glycosyltransferase [Actinomycetota bacterium]